MMTLIDRYIARHILGAFALVLLVITGLDMLFALIDQLPDVQGDYTFLAACQFILISSPARLYEFIPLASLIGCLLGLGILASSSELTVMRAAGISTLGIIKAVMKPVLVIIMLAMLLGEMVVPYSEQWAQSFRKIRMTSSDLIHDSSQIWHRDDLTFVNINAVTPDGQVVGITRYEFNQDLSLKRSSFARSGRYDGYDWLLKNVQETRFPALQGEKPLSAEHSTKTDILPEERWQTGLTPELLSVVMVEPVNLTLSGLLEYSDYLKEQGLAADQYRVAFWTKLLLPLSVLALVLVAISFIFGPLRSVPVGQRLITGIIIGLAFKLTQDIIGPVTAVFGVAPLIAVLIPITLCAALGIWLLRRVR